MMLADQSEGPLQRRYLEGYARHLLRVHKDAQSVRVRRYAQWPLPRQLALDRKMGYQEFVREMARNGENHQISDEGYELIQPEVVQRRSDLPPDPTDGTFNWHGDRANVAGRWTGGPPR
jgi:hypothetical protein